MRLFEAFSLLVGYSAISGFFDCTLHFCRRRTIGIERVTCPTILFVCFPNGNDVAGIESLDPHWFNIILYVEERSGSSGSRVQSLDKLLVDQRSRFSMTATLHDHVTLFFIFTKSLMVISWRFWYRGFRWVRLVLMGPSPIFCPASRSTSLFFHCYKITDGHWLKLLVPWVQSGLPLHCWTCRCPKSTQIQTHSVDKTTEVWISKFQIAFSPHKFFLWWWQKRNQVFYSFKLICLKFLCAIIKKTWDIKLPAIQIRFGKNLFIGIWLLVWWSFPSKYNQRFCVLSSQKWLKKNTRLLSSQSDCSSWSTDVDGYVKNGAVLNGGVIIKYSSFRQCVALCWAPSTDWKNEVWPTLLCLFIEKRAIPLSLCLFLTE